MTDIDSVASHLRCATCDKELKSGALFCTSCGTRRDVAPAESVPTDSEKDIASPADEAAPNEATGCASCGQPLRPGAEFCTECGSRTADDDIDLTVDGGTDLTIQHAVERVSPAESRAILKSVGGAGSGYVTARATTGSGAAKPPASAVRDLDEPPDKKRHLIVVGVAAAAVLLVVVAVLALAGGGHNDKVVAGKSATGVDTAASIKNAHHSGRGDGTSTSTSGTSSATTGSSGSDSTSPASKPGGTSGSKSTSKSGSSRSGSSNAGDSGSGSSGGGPAAVGGDGPPAPNAVPPVVYVPGVAQLSASGSVALTGTATWGTVRITNSGGQNMSWSAVPAGVPNVVVSPPNGTLQPGQGINVTVSWSPWVAQGAARPASDEGVWSGAVDVNAPGVGNARLSLTADNRAADAIWRVAISSCVPTSNPNVCAAQSTIRIYVNRVAQGRFTGALPVFVTYQVQQDIERSCALPDPTRGCSSSDANGTYPGNNFVVPVGSSIKNGMSVAITVTDGAGVLTSRTLTLGG